MKYGLYAGREGLQANDDLLAEAIQQRAGRCANGLQQHLATQRCAFSSLTRCSPVAAPMTNVYAGQRLAPTRPGRLARRARGAGIRQDRSELGHSFLSDAARGAAQAAIHSQRGKADTTGAHPNRPWPPRARLLADHPGRAAFRAAPEGGAHAPPGQEPELVVQPAVSARPVRRAHRGVTVCGQSAARRGLRARLA